jgi:hypothetical protein
MCEIDTDADGVEPWDPNTEQSTIAATTKPRLDGNPEMATTIGTGPDGDYQIGYVGLGFLSEPGLKPLAISPDGIDPYVLPTPETVGDGSYPMGRGLHVVKLEEPGYNKPLIDTFISWLFTPKGQAMVIDEGFVNVQPAAPDWDVNADHNGNIGDVITIGYFWGQSGPANWLRADANNDGNVNIGDVITVGYFWNQTW